MRGVSEQCKARREGHLSCCMEFAYLLGRCGWRTGGGAWVHWKTRAEECSGRAENSPGKGKQSKGEHMPEAMSVCLLKLLSERNYSEKWHMKRLSHSEFSMDINSRLSNHVRMGTRG